MTADSLELQLSITLRRFTALHRHLHEHDAESSRLLASALKELERALKVVHAAQHELVENYRRLDHTQAELAEQHEKYWRLFEDMPQPYLITQRDTTITDANRAAAGLLNVSAPSIGGQALSRFVCEDRAQFLENAARAPAGASIELNLRIRPRRRAPVRVAATVRGATDSLRWILRPGP